MTDKPEIVAWRYRYKGGKWTVQKNKPHWYKPNQADVELQPLVVASDAPSSALLAADRLAEALQKSMAGLTPHPQHLRNALDAYLAEVRK